MLAASSVQSRSGGKRPALELLPSFVALVPKFQRALVLKGLSVVTVSGHVKAIGRQTARFGTTHPPTETVDQFVCDLFQSGASYSHKANNATALEYWLEFIGAPRRFRRPRKPRRVVTDVLSEAEINRLFFVTRSIKEKALLALLAYGLRPKEICQVKRRDLDVARQTIFIRQGKGAKDALITIPPAAVAILIQLLADAPRAANDWLLTTYQGRQYTTGAARKAIKVLARRAGFTRRTWPYMLRHSYATNLLVRGAHLEYIRQQMRHAWIDTTYSYLSSVPHLGSVEHLHPHYF